MSRSLASLRRQIVGAGDLESVVRSMKALAASSIGQYEQSLRALDDYARTLELGLVACMRERGDGFSPSSNIMLEKAAINVIVFGSDQGFVGQFNDILADFTVKSFKEMIGPKNVWAVGARLHARLSDVGLEPIRLFSEPVSINAITPLVEQIIIDIDAHEGEGKTTPLFLIHNQPKFGADFEPKIQQLLPLDQKWYASLVGLKWPTKNIAEVVGTFERTLHELVQACLFVSIFKACAESLASENSSRLAAMRRAEKNIGALQDDLNQKFRRLRQTSIDEELFDVLSGYEFRSSIKS